MSEKLSIDAKVTPVHVADDAVGIPKSMHLADNDSYVWDDYQLSTEVIAMATA